MRGVASIVKEAYKICEMIGVLVCDDDRIDEIRGGEGEEIGHGTVTDIEEKLVGILTHEIRRARTPWGRI
jgi:hypothetical protein